MKFCGIDLHSNNSVVVVADRLHSSATGMTASMCDDSCIAVGASTYE